MELKMVDVSKCYQKKIQALNHVSLTLEHGVYGLLGPNGAGKSTLIQILTGNVRQTSGQIYYNGQNISKIEKLYKTVLGYVPQNQGIYDSFTATKFLEYMGVLKGLTKREIKTQLEEVLHTVGLFEVRERKLGGYSGGMKQRVLIAQALLGNPKLIILDEPTAGLDPKERIRIRNFISRIAEDKIILIATHVVSDVSSIAKEIILLGKGEIKKQDTPEKLCEAIYGEVFETQIEPKQIDILSEHAYISNLQELHDGNLLVRFINKDKNIEEITLAGIESKLVFPDLQEVYLSTFQEIRLAKEEE